MENSNRNHRVLAGVLTAAMVLSSFSMATTGAFAATTPEQNRIAATALKATTPFSAPTTATAVHDNADVTYADAEAAVEQAVKNAATTAGKTAN